MIIRRAQTRGERYAVEVQQVGAGHFRVAELTRGHECGAFVCNTLSEANADFDRIVVDRLRYDRIRLVEWPQNTAVAV